MRTLISLFTLLFACSAAGAVPSIVEPVSVGVTVVRDDDGQWRSDLSNAMTHQIKPEYQAKKVLDLSGVPEALWQRVKKVRLSACLLVRDYSWRENPPANGLDEAFEIVINGKVHHFRTNCGVPVYPEGKLPVMAWHDFVVPKEEFTRGVNEIVFRKAAVEKKEYDDYLYLAIDNSVRRGNSSVTFDGQVWMEEKLTIPGGNGEYMVRLYLIEKETQVRVDWAPGTKSRLEDPARLIGYAGSPAGEPTDSGLRLAPGESARIEWNPASLDTLEPVNARITATGGVQTAWLDPAGEPVEKATGAKALERVLPGGRAFRPSGLVVTAADGPVVLQSVRLDASESYHPKKRPIDMAPKIADPAGKQVKRAPSCRITPDGAVLQNASLRCRFERDTHLRLASIHNEWTACEMVSDPGQVALFLVEVDGKRYAGNRDFRCASLKPHKGGFVAELALEEPALRATLTAGIDAEGLRLGLTLANAGKAPVDFKLAFPHLAGLTASGNPEEDYYFFPWGGGVIADVPVIVRKGYGDHEAIYQVMDLYSPSRGAGLYLRADDSEGWHKVLSLRKHLPGTTEIDAQNLGMKVDPEYIWTNPLDAVKGTSFAYEYLRRTRPAGGSFSPAPAVLAAHPGDWHAAMRAYSAWAHRVWKFRPYPSRLKSVRNMIAAGWGQGYLFRDGKYRTDIIKEDTDCIELMSWWDWSPLGPWGTPIDQIAEKYGEAKLKYWQSYLVKDPVTGQMMWNNQPGDYDGYNERFGGLPAFREAVETYRKMGALVTLYTDPIRCDYNSKAGKEFGERWGVVKPDGKHVDSYDVWNICHDVAEYREWVAKTMGRVMRETGADGIRLDEYGHRGWACYSKLHEHTYAEPGITQWQKAIAETCRVVRQAMDEVKPDSVLTTEHPGYDYELQFLEGCITYDLTVMATPLRPLECNLQRFYFPECKAYELDHRRADLKSRKKLWNAVESFGRYYPPAMYALLNENEDVYQGRECEPLVPTLAQYIYANQFGAGQKVLYHLYNAKGYTFEGPALAIQLKRGEHLFDLLRCREVPVAKGVASIYLERDDVTVLAKLPRRLNVARQGEMLRVTAKGAPARAQVVVSDLEGKVLLSQPARQATLDLSKLPADAKPACVKLLGPNGLLDAVALP